LIAGSAKLAKSSSSFQPDWVWVGVFSLIEGPFVRYYSLYDNPREPPCGKISTPPRVLQRIDAIQQNSFDVFVIGVRAGYICLAEAALKAR